MKKLFFVTLLLALLLSACSEAKPTTAVVTPTETAAPTETKVQATIANDDGARTTQVVVEKFITAYQKLDADLLLSLFSDNITIKSCTSGCSIFRMDELKTAIPMDWRQPGWEYNFVSYSIMDSGIFAVVQGTFKNPVNVKVPSPVTTVLEIYNGKIVNATWYFMTTY